MNNTAIQTFVKKTRSVCFRIPYPLYETLCEQAEKLDLTLTDYFLLKLKNANNTASNIDNTNVIQPISNPIQTKPKNQMAELNDSPTRAELKIDRLEQVIEKHKAEIVELNKALTIEKEKLKTAEAKHKAEEDAHKETKKEIPSKEDLLTLHASKADNILHPLIEANSMEAIGADEDDLEELGIHPIVHENLKEGEVLETTNLKIQKHKKGKLPEGKTILISSQYSKK